MTAYYNEFDSGAANWLRELMANGLIAPGVVDERSIKEVDPVDLLGFTQCHFFAGIGVWSHALRRAGWPDERPVWTGSCPCQPFSLAGKGQGTEDPRHLWPDFFRLIRQCRPDPIFGEQVASAGAWLDLVSADPEAAGYAFGVPDLCAAGFTGAHIRQRFFWVADRDNTERWSDLAGGDLRGWPATGRIEGYGESRAGGDAGGLEHDHGHGQGSERSNPGEMPGLPPVERPELGAVVSGRGSDAGGLGHHHHHQGPQVGPLTPDSRGALRVEGPTIGAAGSLLGCDWLLCRDSKVRPVEVGTFPLAPTSPGRVGLLRGYGNGLDVETAVNFINAFIEAEMLA